MTLTAQKAIRTGADRDRVWFETTFKQYWNRIYGLLVRLVGDSPEAEDLALETFLRLHNRMPIGEVENPAGWLYRVATNLGLNAVRAQRRRQRYETEAGFQALESEADSDPASSAQKAQERQWVRAALATMKPRTAQLLLLRHSGMSYAEVAAALGLSAGSVGTLLSRAEREFEQRYRALEGERHAHS